MCIFGMGTAAKSFSPRSDSATARKATWVLCMASNGDTLVLSTKIVMPTTATRASISCRKSFAKSKTTQQTGELSCLHGIPQVRAAWFTTSFKLHLLTRVALPLLSTADLGKMALPPCHMFCQFYVTLPTEDSPKPKLSCLMYQRSADLGLGVPFNIASYALLTHLIARATDTEAHEFILQLGDAHVYKDHVDALKVQLQREPKEFPKVHWKSHQRDIDAVTTEDFELVDYKPHPKIDMAMSYVGFLCVASDALISQG